MKPGVPMYGERADVEVSRTSRAPNPGLRAIACGIGIVLSSTLGQPGVVAAQDDDPAAARAAFVAKLANLTDGAWITSNAEYRATPDEDEIYGLALELMPGGMSAVGCLWGEIDGEVSGVYWNFFQAWDPVEGKGMLYQSNAGGAVGFGHFDEGRDPVLVQEFHWPTGTEMLGHFEEWPDADTHVAGSLARENGEWVPRRTYTWVRKRNRPTPCG